MKHPSILPLPLPTTTLFATTLFATTLALSASVPLRWTVETSRAVPATFEAYQGETLAFEAALQSYGKPLAAPSEYSLYWQTNGMGNAWWSQKVEGSNSTVPLPTTTTTNVLFATWSPTNDVGARAYNCFIGQPGTIYHAAFQLRLRPSPGATPNELPLPQKVIDFAKVTVLNPPWPTNVTPEAVRAIVQPMIEDATTNKADRSDLDGYLPLTGGSLTGNLGVEGGNLSVGNNDYGKTRLYLVTEDSDVYAKIFLDPSGVSAYFDVSCLYGRMKFTTGGTDEQTVLEVTGDQIPASIKKDGKEVATEDQVFARREKYDNTCHWSELDGGSGWDFSQQLAIHPDWKFEVWLDENIEPRYWKYYIDYMDEESGFTLGESREYSTLEEAERVKEIVWDWDYSDFRGTTTKRKPLGNIICKDGELFVTPSFVTNTVNASIEATNPTFSNAVLAVGLNIDTNSVAAIGAMVDIIHDFPIDPATGATTVGGLLATLAAAMAWLKKNKADKAELPYETNSAAALKDRAVNQLGALTASYTLTIPDPAASGKPRDFLLRYSSSGAVEFQYSGITLYGDLPSTDKEGDFLVAITEVGTNQFYCRKIELEDAE